MLRPFYAKSTPDLKFGSQRRDLVEHVKLFRVPTSKLINDRDADFNN